MKNILRLTAFISGLLLFTNQAFSQDSASAFSWKLASKKISDGVYELVFSTDSTGKWQLYSPSQKIDLQTTDLQFNDSAITRMENFQRQVL